MKPRIILNGGPAYDKQFMSKSLVINKTYSMALAASGAVPFLAVDKDCIEEYAEFGDGLIMTGTVYFSPHPERLDELERKWGAERKAFDTALFEAFKKRGKPIIGICFGHQEINEQLGGTLLEDFKYVSGVEHSRTTHTIKTFEGSVLYRLFGSEFYTNSRHNYRVDKLGEGLKVTAVSKDQVIEAFEHEILPIYGFEFHPERMRGDLREPPEGPDMSPLFAEFVEICRINAEKFKR